METENIVTFFVAGTLLVSVFAFFLIYFIILQRNRRNQYYNDTQRLIVEHKIRESDIRLKENERTMSQISKEIHDNVGQVSSLIRMHLHYLEPLLVTEQQSDVINRINNLADKLIETTNNISHSLNGDFIREWGLQSLINDDLGHIKISRKIGCDIETIGKNRFLDAEKQLIIYRIAQEAMNNILKHSGAKSIKVTLDFSENTFIMRIEDDGVGFIYDTHKKAGTGLINMTERAKCLNARLDIQTSPGDGCVTTLWLQKNEDDLNEYPAM